MTFHQTEMTSLTKGYTLGKNIVIGEHLAGVPLNNRVFWGTLLYIEQEQKSQRVDVFNKFFQIATMI